jgi:pimeloyl-ACP methyl ester carboxylesterase
VAEALAVRDRAGVVADAGSVAAVGRRVAPVRAARAMGRGQDERPSSAVGYVPSDRPPPTWLDRAAYPFRNKWMPLAFGALHYVDEGRGDPVLFSHGTPTWSFEWRHLIRALSATHRCIAADHLGFGLSDRPPEASYTPESHAERFALFVDALGLDSFTLVVHDYGGPIALPVAVDDRRDVQRLVIVNSWMWRLDNDPDMRRAGRIAGGRIGRFLYRWANLSLRVIMPSAYADRHTLTREIHTQYLAPFRDRWSRGAVLWPLAHALLGSSAYYDALYRKRDRLRDIPTLIVWGTRDPAFKPHHLARWRSMLPDAGVVELPVGHWPHEEDPEGVATALTDFLTATK